jgi:GTPase SAR1 family protein
MTPMYFRDAQGVLFVFDLTCKITFFGLVEWFKLVRENAPASIGTGAFN